MKNLEREYVFFCKMTPEFKNSIEQLSSDIILQEQWAIVTENPVPKGSRWGSVRVRKETEIKTGKVSLTLAVKTDSNTAVDKSKGYSTVIENEQSISNDMFTTFKLIAPFGQIKTRYVIPLEGFDIEVDTFQNKKGGVDDWCKVDIEVNNKTAGKTLPDMSDWFSKKIDAADQNSTQEVFVNYLFNVQWGIFNEINLLPVVSDRSEMVKRAKATFARESKIYTDINQNKFWW